MSGGIFIWICLSVFKEYVKYNSYEIKQQIIVFDFVFNLLLIFYYLM